MITGKIQGGMACLKTVFLLFFSQGLLQLIKLYVCRSHHIWKEPDLIPWLERNVHTVLDRVNSGKEEAFIADCATKRESRYVGTPRNISRHIILSDFKEVTAHLTTVSKLKPKPLR